MTQMLRTIRTRASEGVGSDVDLLVQKARTQAGVERILVVYGADAARIYVEGEKAVRPRPVERPS
jgi:ribosomal protein L19